MKMLGFSRRFKKILKQKVLRIKNSIRQNASELESSLFGLFRRSHLPYKAKSEKGSIFLPKKLLFKGNLRKLLIFHKSHGKVTGWGGTTIITIGLVDRGG